VDGALQLREWLAEALAYGNRYTVAAAILLLAALRPSWGIAALCLLYLFAGYPSLRFSTRHVFHLEFISWWVVALWLQVAWSFGWRYVGAYAPNLPPYPVMLKRAAAMGAFAIVASLVPWQAMKWYQDGRVEALMHLYVDAPRTALNMEDGSRGRSPSRDALIQLSGFADLEAQPSDLPSHCEVLVIETVPGEAPLELAFEFLFDHEHYDFRRTVTVPPGVRGDTTVVYYPV